MQLPQNVHIANDGETIRILGVWAGNDARDDDTWEKVIEGRRRLVQAYIGGGTQYLTAAQGMPPAVLKRFKKLELDSSVRPGAQGFWTWRPGTMQYTPHGCAS